MEVLSDDLKVAYPSWRVFMENINDLEADRITLVEFRLNMKYH